MSDDGRVLQPLIAVSMMLNDRTKYGMVRVRTEV
jgi:hypothetical protein